MACRILDISYRSIHALAINCCKPAEKISECCELYEAGRQNAKHSIMFPIVRNPSRGGAGGP